MAVFTVNWHPINLSAFRNRTPFSQFLVLHYQTIKNISNLQEQKHFAFQFVLYLKDLFKLFIDVQQICYSIGIINQLSLQMTIADNPSIFYIQYLKNKKRGLKNTLVSLVLFFVLFISCYTFGHWIWTTFLFPQLKTMSKQTFLIVFGCVAHTLTALVSLMFYLPAYLGRPSWIDKYQIKGVNPWPWLRPNWPQWKIKTFMHLSLVHLVYFPIGLYVSTLDMKMRFDGFPSLRQYILQIVFLTYSDDLFFFLTHRTLHSPWLYKKIHKQHHQYDTPFSSISQYAHPIEYFFGNMLPSAFGIIVLGSNLHAFTYLMFVVHKVFDTYEGHSGYDVPWSPMRVIPFANSNTHHNFHHSKNVGAFGGFTYIWDHVFGSNKEYYKMIYQIQ